MCGAAKLNKLSPCSVISFASINNIDNSSSSGI